MRRVNMTERNWPILLSLFGVILVACNTFEATSAKPQIIFVTPTPGNAIALTEGQRFQVQPLAPLPAQPAPTPYFAGANELGKVLVLEYHRIGYPEQRYQRTPENLRADLARLRGMSEAEINTLTKIAPAPNPPTPRPKAAHRF